MYEDIYDAKTAVDHLSGFNVANRYLIVLCATATASSGCRHDHVTKADAPAVAGTTTPPSTPRRYAPMLASLCADCCTGYT